MKVSELQETKYITFISDRKKVVLDIGTIIYAVMAGKGVEIHVANGNVYETRMPLKQVEAQLGEGFIKLHRGCLVSVKAIHDITDTVNLSNGESLLYTIRKKRQIIEELHAKQKKIIHTFNGDGIPETEEEYRSQYISFENLPFAFTDIEMVFNEERHAVDWIFRYGNPALARLEKLPLEQMIGNSFGSLFANMDSKWLRSYERSALYGEILEIMDYSPEIDTYLKVISFPTFKGHCGCILFDISDIKMANSSSQAEKTMMMYLSKILADHS